MATVAAAWTHCSTTSEERMGVGTSRTSTRGGDWSRAQKTDFARREHRVQRKDRQREGGRGITACSARIREKRLNGQSTARTSREAPASQPDHTSTTHGLAVDPVGGLVLDAELERAIRLRVDLGQRVRHDVDAGRLRAEGGQLDAGAAGAARVRRGRVGSAVEARAVRVAGQEAVDEPAKSELAQHEEARTSPRKPCTGRGRGRC